MDLSHVIDAYGLGCGMFQLGLVGSGRSQGHWDVLLGCLTTAVACGCAAVCRHAVVQ